MAEGKTTEDPITTVETCQVRADVTNLIRSGIVISQIHVVANGGGLGLGCRTTQTAITRRREFFFSVTLRSVLMEESTAVDHAWTNEGSLLLVRRAYFMRYSK